MSNFLPNGNKYLENLAIFILQMKEIKDYMVKKGEAILECYLLNNDMINLYLKNEKISDCINYIDDYKKSFNIQKYNDLYNEIHIKQIIKIFHDYNVNIKNINLFPIFLLTEKMICNGINIPYNFFILKQDLFNKIFGNDPNYLKDFILYKVLICKEGIFIWNEKNEKIIIYYLYYLNQETLNENKFSKVFMFKTMADFYKELNIIEKLGRKEYFKTRNIQNKNGYYNLTYDGKIIGHYINMNINENFESKNSNEEYANNIDYMNEVIDLDSKKNFLINIILSNLLTCFSKIKILKDLLIKRMKLNNKNINNKNYILINKLTEFITYFSNGDDNKIQEILNNFHNEFKTKDLYSKIETSEENKFKFFENIIKIFLNELNKEAFSSYNENNFGEKNNKSFIFNLFYGEKTSKENTPKEFNTIFIDPEYYSGNHENIKLDEIINSNLFQEKERIIYFPKILIFIILYKYKDFMIAPLKLKLTSKNYNLLGCIQYVENNFASIISEKKYFIRIFWNEENKFFCEDILEQDRELNNCFTYFYEQEEENNIKEFDINNYKINKAIKNYIKNSDLNNNNFKIFENNNNDKKKKNNNLNLNLPNYNSKIYNNIKFNNSNNKDINQKKNIQQNNNYKHHKCDIKINNNKNFNNIDLNINTSKNYTINNLKQNFLDKNNYNNNNINENSLNNKNYYLLSYNNNNSNYNNINLNSSKNNNKLQFCNNNTNNYNNIKLNSNSYKYNPLK